MPFGEYTLVQTGSSAGYGDASNDKWAAHIYEELAVAQIRVVSEDKIYVRYGGKGLNAFLGDVINSDLGGDAFIITVPCRNSHAGIVTINGLGQIRRALVRILVDGVLDQNRIDVKRVQALAAVPNIDLILADHANLGAFAENALGGSATDSRYGANTGFTSYFEIPARLSTPKSKLAVPYRSERSVTAPAGTNTAGESFRGRDPRYVPACRRHLARGYADG